MALIKRVAIAAVMSLLSEGCIAAEAPVAKGDPVHAAPVAQAGAPAEKVTEPNNS